ncbi:uncharacterized protein LOC132266836 isoform X2 [Cornus florida]|uniref:uncharacterized protein LOC132266836 isoform X2 n=1 Tax=Cornus florida TaxID=4283 RepID=UPI00289BD1F9|nr:uncharacterized protein LOC132266836 isoform X2 [Cornus florida]
MRRSGGVRAPPPRPVPPPPPPPGISSSSCLLILKAYKCHGLHNRSIFFNCLSSFLDDCACYVVTAAPQPPKQLLKETGAAYGAGYAIGSRLTERGVDAVLDPPSSKFNMELIYEFDTEGGCRAVLVPKAWPDQQGT